MKTAIIHFEPLFSGFAQSFRFKKALKSSYIIKKDGKYKLPIYRIPVYEKNPSDKATRKFCEFLKQEKIERILFSKETKRVPRAVSFLKNNFPLFTGETVINCSIVEILRKYAAKQDKVLGESTLCVETDSPQKAERMIKKIYKHVKKIKLKTKYPDRFQDIREQFLKDCGLFIEINSPKTASELLVQLDSMLPKEEALHLCFDETAGSKIIFKIKNGFTEFEKMTELNQSAIEFLICLQFGKLSEQAVLQFFKSHSVKISKIL